jgi:hypothetical protein
MREKATRNLPLGELFGRWCPANSQQKAKTQGKSVSHAVTVTVTVRLRFGSRNQVTYGYATPKGAYRTVTRNRTQNLARERPLSLRKISRPFDRRKSSATDDNCPLRACRNGRFPSALVVTYTTRDIVLSIAYSNFRLSPQSPVRFPLAAATDSDADWRPWKRLPTHHRIAPRSPPSKTRNGPGSRMVHCCQGSMAAVLGSGAARMSSARTCPTFPTPVLPSVQSSGARVC